MHIQVKKKFLFYNKYKVKCAIGKRGINIKRKEGDLVTPKGSFKVKKIFYRKDRIKSLPAKIKKIEIKKNMGWCDDPRSKNYNKLIKYPFDFKSEKLFRSDNIYDIILVLNFNMNPIKKNKVSAIFLHIANKKYSSTKGCVAISKIALKKLIKLLSYNSKIIIA